MKKLLLLTLLSMLSVVLKANDFDFGFKYGENDIGFRLVTNKINIRLKEPLTQEELFSRVKYKNLVMDKNDQGNSNTLWMLQLDNEYTLEEINKIISDLDKNDDVDYASPLLDYNGDLAAMSTQIIIGLQPGQGTEDLATVCERDGLTDLGVRDYLPESVHILQLPRESITKQFDFIADLSHIGVAFAQPNLIRYLHKYIAFNDPEYVNQYALTKINATGAWTHTAGGAQTIKIAVIDEGIDLSHTDLAGQSINGFDATYYLPSSTPPSPASQSWLNSAGGYANNDSHGTMCAGTIAAKPNNSEGIVGLAYNCKIVPIRFAYNIYDTIFTTDDVIMASAIYYARTMQVDVISNSWGGGSPSPVVDGEIHSAILNGRSGKGCPVFFASGNESSTTLPWPASLPDVIAVGATDANDTKTSFSNYSTYLDISAPGDGIITTDLSGSAGENTTPGPAGSYSTVSGTSFSCPYAAALMGLILSVNPGLTQPDARMVIETTCAKTGGYSYHTDPFSPNGNWCDELGYGRIDADAAVTKAASLLPLSGGALTTVLTPEASPVCYDSNNNPYFDIKVTGAVPFTGVNPPYDRYYMLGYYTSNTYATPYPYINTNGQTSMIVSSTNPTTPVSNTKRIYLNAAALASATFPLSTTIFIDVMSQGSSGGAVHNHLAATVNFNIGRGPDVILAPDIYACEGTPLALTSQFGIAFATPPLAFSCNFGGFTGDPSTLTITSPVGEGAVALTVSDQSGCSVTKTSIVHFVHTVIGGDGSIKKICVGSPTIPMGATVSNGHGTLTYSWFPAAGLSATNVLNPNFTATGTPGIHYYQLAVTDGIGCVQLASFTVDVQAPQSTVTISPDLNNICPGHTVILTGTITPAGIYSPVAFSDASTTYPTAVLGTTATTAVNPFTTTTYTLTAVDDHGCANTGTVNITVNTAYGLFASAGPDIIGCAMPLKPAYSNVAGGTPPYTYQWMPGNSTADFIKVSNVPQTYTLTVTDNNGCKATDQVAVTADPAFHPDGLPIYSVVMGQAVQMLPPGYYSGAWTTGGTPPYTYEWTPHHDFTNPLTMYPTTIPLVQTIMPTLTVTDANGCQVALNQYLMTYETPSPPEIYEEADPCSGRQICVDVNPGVGLVYKGDRDANGSAIDLNNPAAGSVPNPEQYVTNSFTYSPAPVSASGNCATFSAGTTSVAITIVQNTSNAMPGSVLQTPPITINYSFPPMDNARHFMVALKNNIDMIYVGTDQLLHRWFLHSTINGAYWDYQKIMPTNGWGSVRVEGWLAQNETGTRVFFKGTDQHLYSIARYAGTDNWLLEYYNIGVTVKSDIVYRESGNELYYVGNDNLLQRVYWYNHAWHYEAVSPVGGWQGVSIDGYLALEPTPGTHVYFKGNDNQLYNTWGGTLTSPNLNMMPTMNGCAGEIIYNPNTSGLLFKGYDDHIHGIAWNAAAGNWQDGVMLATTSYGVDNYLAFDAATNRVFYKAYDQTIHNIYPVGSQNYDGPLLDPQYSSNYAAGDVIYNNNQVFYINKDKNVHHMEWVHIGIFTGWMDNALFYYVMPNMYAKTCTNQYRAMMVAGDPDDDGSSDQPTSVTDNAMDPTLVNVYPNPSEGQFTIEINSGTTAVIDVYDVLGNKVKSIQKEKDKATYELDLSAYGKGIYMIGITSDGKHTSKKIMIK